MRVSFDALDQTDELTSKELPLLEDDEKVVIRKYRDFPHDATAERLAMRPVEKEVPRRIRLRDDEDEPEEDEEPEQRGPFFVDQGEYLKLQFEYMAVSWEIYEPADAKGHRKSIVFNKANRAKFVDLHGAHLMGQMLIRGGGIVPDLKGAVNPDTGDKLTFREDS